LTVGNAIYMEPVEGVEAVPKNRWKLVSVSFLRKMFSEHLLKNRLELRIMSGANWRVHSVRQSELLHRLSRDLREADGTVDEHEIGGNRRIAWGILRQAHSSKVPLSPFHSRLTSLGRQAPGVSATARPPPTSLLVQGEPAGDRDHIRSTPRSRRNLRVLTPSRTDPVHLLYPMSSSGSFWSMWLKSQSGNGSRSLRGFVGIGA